MLFWFFWWGVFNGGVLNHCFRAVGTFHRPRQDDFLQCFVKYGKLLLTVMFRWVMYFGHVLLLKSVCICVCV